MNFLRDFKRKIAKKLFNILCPDINCKGCLHHYYDGASSECMLAKELGLE